MLVIFLVVLCAGLSSSTCPPDYSLVLDQCYKVITSEYFDSTSITQADEICAKAGGHLASFHSAEVEQAVIDSLSDPKPAFAFGLQCNSETDCAWTDGTPYDYSNFHGGFTLEYGNCVFTLPSATDNTHYWYSQDCSSFYMYMCQTTPYDAKCSGDYTEWYGECIKAKSGPLAEDDAEKDCVAEGGHLASVHRKLDAPFYDDLAKKAGILSELYIGLQYNVATNYTWTDGSYAGETNWASGFPLSYFGNCVQFLREDSNHAAGQWSNVQCNTKLPYFCKRSITV